MKLFFLTLISSLTVFASAVKTPSNYPIDEVSTFNAPLMSVDCKDKFLMRYNFTSEQLLNYTKTVIEEGLQEISQINPQFARVATERFAATKIVLGCEAPAEYTGYLAEVIPTGFLSKSFRARLGGLFEKHLNEKTLSTEAEMRNTIFHELLHTISVDNQSIRDHANTLYTVENDVVYNCSQIAHEFEEISFLQLRRENRLNVCITCASAEISTGSSTLNRSEIKENFARNVCENYLGN